ncbi:hypothetical protein V2J09_001205 [Rumex salicifolius]
MEAEDQKTLERVVSHKALQMSSSFPCQICVAGFLCGVCIASLFLAALTSFGTLEIRGLSFSRISAEILPFNSSSHQIINIVTTGGYNSKTTTRIKDNLVLQKRGYEEKVTSLYSAWTAMLENESVDDKSRIPRAPHIENCKLKAQITNRLDKRNSSSEKNSFPPWTSWRGSLDLYPSSKIDEQFRNSRFQDVADGAYPPWVSGSDEENYPLTRKVQRDIWLNQHPTNCNDPQVKFLVADWERIPGFGIGAQIAGMTGLLAIAIRENRVLVTSVYNRADHDGCKGSSRASWSCYFLPETSQECRERAFGLMKRKEAWEKGIIRAKDNYTSKTIWAGQTPRQVNFASPKWGNPWSYLQPTTEINGSFVTSHRKMDRRWWRAQAVRYLMRFPSEYTCQLMNSARHAAFGKEAAERVLASNGGELPKEGMTSDIEKYVWFNHKPWIPRPLLSMHVRMGDKACEMKVVEFEDYMKLANRIRKHFPHLNSIWLSTEMQEVIDKTSSYPQWNFYYTEVKRQVGNISMAKYEESLGRETGTNYPLVNFLMATDADFFIGALGSTWCFLIDGMRNTGGKVMAGYLSVNKDRSLPGGSLKSPTEEWQSHALGVAHNNLVSNL